MTVDHNKAVSLQFFARFTASDIDGALGMMTDYATWWIAGKKERFPTARLYTKEKICRLFHRLLAALKDGQTMTVKSSIGEGNFVALEAE